MNRMALWCVLWIAAAGGIWGISYAVASRSAPTPVASGYATSPAPVGSRYTPLQTGARTCSRCGAALDGGECVIVARDGRVAFRGCGDCLVRLLDSPRLEIGDGHQGEGVSWIQSGDTWQRCPVDNMPHVEPPR